VRLKPIAGDELEYGESVEQETREMILPFQNEYLYAALVDQSCGNSHEQILASKAEILCTVPDLISLVGTDGYALGTQDIRYGIRVSVVAFTAHPHW
jgi:DUF917 family protein